MSKRWSLVVQMFVGAPDLLNYRSSGESRLDSNPDHPSSARLDGFAAHDGVLGPVGTLYQNVGLKETNDLVRCVFVEHDDRIDRAERCERFRPLGLRRDRSTGSLVGTNGTIGVDANHQRVAEGSGAL